MKLTVISFLKKTRSVSCITSTIDGNSAVSIERTLQYPLHNPPLRTREEGETHSGMLSSNSVKNRIAKISSPISELTFYDEINSGTVDDSTQP
jgi:hypothetical protein